MVHKKEEGTYHYIEKLTKDMPRFLSLSLDSSEYSGVNKDQRIPDRSKTAHRKPPVKCFLTMRPFLLTGTSSHSWERVSRPQHLHIQIQNGLLSSFFSPWSKEAHIFSFFKWIHRVTGQQKQETPSRNRGCL